jgi:hypothetical protein
MPPVFVAPRSATFSGRRTLVQPETVLGVRMPGTRKEPSPGRADVESALLQLVKHYVSADAPLSAWEQHCLSSALLFERYGYFDKALKKINEVLEPPFRLPVFPTPPQITLRDVMAHLLQSTGTPRLDRGAVSTATSGPGTVPGETEESSQ